MSLEKWVPSHFSLVSRFLFLGRKKKHRCDRFNFTQVKQLTCSPSPQEIQNHPNGWLCFGGDGGNAIKSLSVIYHYVQISLSACRPVSVVLALGIAKTYLRLSLPAASKAVCLRHLHSNNKSASGANIITSGDGGK